MNDQVIRQILQRLGKLERESARLRIGEVTDVGPLDVALGGSDTSYEDVATLGGPSLADGDTVAALVSGNDLLVLGAIGGLRIVRGTVNGLGVIVEGSGFSAAKLAGTGEYTVAFTTAFSDVPSVVFGVGSVAQAAIKVNGSHLVTASGFGVFTFTTSTLAGVNTDWHFIAVGPT